MTGERLRHATKAKRLNAVFAALADPTRRAIIETLGRGEARVTKLAEPFPMSLSAVSKHIRVLEDIGLVRRRIAGRDHYLTFDSRLLDDAERWIDRARKYWNARLDAMERLLREQEISGNDIDAK
jgi:DNA-binding transcriptional ArsR family regulator